MKGSDVGGTELHSRARRVIGVLRHARLALFGLAAIVGIVGASASAGTIDWVTVGDPGNAAEPTSQISGPADFGAVADSFRIMKFEWTNSQYVDFLNAVDPNGTNPNSIYDDRGVISFTSANASGSKYAALANMGNKPVIFVSWFDAARVANWLHNGQGAASTETGAYTLNNATSGNAPARNAGARFYIPTEDQWYKAAYYKGSGTNAGYWAQATQSNTPPTPVNATAVGTGTTSGVSPVISGNFANWQRAADWNGSDGNLTTVGTNGGPSAYGTFDMSGNVLEWTDSVFYGQPEMRVMRGGSWYDASFSWEMSSHNRSGGLASIGDSRWGFRLASSVSGPSGVPEIDPSGLRLAAALVAGCLALREPRQLSRSAHSS